MRKELGRHVFGAAAFGFGLIALGWHDFNTWQQLQSHWGAPLGKAFVLVAATAELVGGMAIQWGRTTRLGAGVLGIVYLVFALLWIPKIVASPQVYDPWGNFFEQFSLVSAAAIVYADAASDWRWAERAGLIARTCFGICVVSFTLEQLIYLSGTASFVPDWLPPGQMFWAVATTIALAMAAVAILSGRVALLASRLLTVMFLTFGLLVWLPMLLSAPAKHMNWGGNAQNLLLSGAAWIVADYFTRNHATQVLRKNLQIQIS